MSEANLRWQLLLDSYQQLWRYHNKSQDDQIAYVNLFLKGAALPTGLIGAGVLVVERYENVDRSALLGIAGGAILAFVLIGLTIYVSFVQELANQRRYIASIRRIEAAAAKGGTNSSLIRKGLSSPGIAPDELARLLGGFSISNVAWWRAQTLALLNAFLLCIAGMLLLAACGVYPRNGNLEWLLPTYVALFLGAWAAFSVIGKQVYRRYLERFAEMPLPPADEARTPP